MDLNDMELLKLKEQLTPEQNRNIERLVNEKKKKSMGSVFTIICSWWIKRI